MSGQQPPYGQQPQQPPHGQPPPGRPPQPRYGQQPPQGPYGRQPPQGPLPGGGWQPLSNQPEPPRRSRTGTTIAIAGLAALVVALAAVCAYLWFSDDPGATAASASTKEVDLPDELGDFTVQKDGGDDEYAIDLEQTRKDYEEVVGAGFDTKTYVPAGSESEGDGEDSGDSEPPEITVQAVRASLPLTPNYTTKTSSTEVVRDDMLCHLAYYEGYDPDAEDDAGDDEGGKKKQLPQSCARSGDGLTVYVNTYSTSVDEDPPTIDELVEFTDQAYDAAQ